MLWYAPNVANIYTLSIKSTANCYDKQFSCFSWLILHSQAPPPLANNREIAIISGTAREPQTGKTWHKSTVIPGQAKTAAAAAVTVAHEASAATDAAAEATYYSAADTLWYSIRSGDDGLNVFKKILMFLSWETRVFRQQFWWGQLCLI